MSPIVSNGLSSGNKESPIPGFSHSQSFEPSHQTSSSVAVDHVGKRRTVRGKNSPGESVPIGDQERQQGEIVTPSPGGGGRRIDNTPPVEGGPQPEDNEPEEKLQQKSIGSHRLPSVFNLLEQSGNLPAGFKLHEDAAVVQQERQTVYSNRILTYEEAYKRLKPYESIHIDAAIQQRQRYHADHPATEPFTTFAEAEKAKSEIAKIVPDRLEVMREALGLTSRREQLMNVLLKKLSFENGLNIFNEAFQDKPYTTMEEINRDYPSMTATEITLLSLTKAAPALFLKTGKQAPEIIPLSDDIDIDMYNVPRIIGANPSGLIVADELTDPNIHRSVNPYANLGMTLADSSALETTDFSEDIVGTKKRGVQEGGEKENIIDELIFLTISSQRVFERIWDKAESALIDGIGKIDRMALGIVRPDLALSEEALGTLERQLSNGDRFDYEQEKHRIQRTLAQATFGNLRSLEGFSIYDTVRLIGLLDKIPDPLLHADEPFNGFIDPDIHGVQFVDAEKGEHSFVAYNSFYLREALQGLYFEQVDVNTPNATMASIYNALLKQAEVMALDTEELSLLEGIKTDMKLRFDIDFEVHPKMAIENVTVGTSRRVTAKKFHEVWLKFGYEEASDVYEVTTLLPKELLTDVKSIRKQSTLAVDPLGQLGEGKHYFGISFPDGTVVLCQPINIPWAFLSKDIKEFRKDTQLHEFAHFIWLRLSDEEKRDWAAIGWDEEGKPTSQPDPTWVLDEAVNGGNLMENFCNHIPAYCLHGPEFRKKAEENEIVKKKYEYIKKMIAKKIGYVIEYDQVSPLPMMYMEKFIVADKDQETAEQKYLAWALESALTKLEAEDAVENVIERIGDSSEQDQLMADEIEEVNTIGDVMEFHDIDPTSITLRKRGELEQREMELTDLKSLMTGRTDEGANELAAQVYSLIKEGKIKRASRLMRKEIDPDDGESWEAYNFLAKRIRQRFLGGSMSQENLELE